ncbi:MAG: FAD:protein FMN transferase [Flavobacteriales bacterium]|nr:FAD:protein FMN transferase [Flavobacteriales bacterium]
MILEASSIRFIFNKTFLNNLTALGLCFALASCGNVNNDGNPKDTRSYMAAKGEAQGTFYVVKYKADQNLQPGIDSILEIIDLSMSGYMDASIVSRVNRNSSTVQIDNHFANVFNASKEVYSLSGGAFDITVAPLVTYWGFGPTQRDSTDTNSIKSISKHVGMDKIRLDQNRIVKDDTLVTLDFNAIAQGYTVDVIAEYLDRQLIEHYLINVGGEIKAKGINDRGSIWVVGVESPLEEVQIGRYEVAVDLKDKSLATSGSYRKYKVVDGLKYSHTIDPRTGRPVEHNLLSVSVVTDNCMMADAYATTFMVLGLNASKVLLDSLEGVDAYFIFEEEEGEWGNYETYNFRKEIVHSDTFLLE